MTNEKLTTTTQYAAGRAAVMLGSNMLDVGEMRGSYEEEVESQMEEWDAQIEHLKARADLILVDIEERYYGVLRGLRLRERAVRESLRELHEAREWAREEAKRRLDQAIEDLNRALGTVPPELE